MIKYELFPYRKYKSLTKGTRKIYRCVFCKKSPNLKYAYKRLYVSIYRTVLAGWKTEDNVELFSIFTFCNETCLNCFMLSPVPAEAVLIKTTNTPGVYKRVPNGMWHN